MKLLLPYDRMLKKTKQHPKTVIQNLKFRNSLNTFGRDPPSSLHDLGGAKLLCTFVRDVV